MSTRPVSQPGSQADPVRAARQGHCTDTQGPGGPAIRTRTPTHCHWSVKTHTCTHNTGRTILCVWVHLGNQLQPYLEGAPPDSSSEDESHQGKTRVRVPESERLRGGDWIDVLGSYATLKQSFHMLFKAVGRRMLYVGRRVPVIYGGKESRQTWYLRFFVCDVTDAVCGGLERR